MAMRFASIGMLALVAMLGSCGPREVILPGERLDIRAPLEGAVTSKPAVDRAAPIALPPAVVNADWTHKAEAPDHRIGHSTLSPAPVRLFSVPIGSGESRRYRIGADPVVAGGRVFALDSRATVTAHSTGGARLWSRGISPPADRPGDASGGGLAVSGGRLFVTTAFGELVTLDAATGAELWRQDLDAAATGAPTVVGDTVYVVSRDSRGWAIDVATGRVRWDVQGIPDGPGVDGGAAPAVAGDLVFFPFNSAELVAVSRADGKPVWRAQVAGQRPGRVYARIIDITGDPVVAGDVVYAGNPSGRTHAFDRTTGERLWMAEDGAMSPPLVVGGSVFVVTDRNELVRLDAVTGARIWGTELPYYTRERPRRRQAVSAHYGPILASGRLWVGSSDGLLRAFDPVSGALVSTVPLPSGAASNPVVVGGVLYILSENGQLQAFR